MIGINNYSNINLYKRPSNTGVKQNIVSFSRNLKTAPQPNSEKISFMQGAKIVFDGFWQQAKDFVNDIIKHPVKSLFAAVATTVALMALPLIGIPAALGVAVMTAGFAGVGLTKAAYNTSRAVVQNQKGEYDKAKTSLRKAGAAGVDLALSVPFWPKGLKVSNDFLKFGKVGVNTSLISNIKAAKGFDAKLDLLKSANKELVRNYDYSSVVEKQMSKLKVSDAKKAAIKKELMDFNVPEDKILEVALSKLKEEHGLNFEIEMKKRPTSAEELGYFSSYSGEIVVKDYKKPNTAARNRLDSKIEKIENFDEDKYKCTLVDLKTGKHNIKLISKKVYDVYNILRREQAKNTHNGNNLLTLVHEFEHLLQFGDITAQYGIIEKVSSSGRSLALKVAKARKPLSVERCAEASKYKIAKLNYNAVDPVEYLENYLEQCARKKELAAMRSDRFKRLESVFRNLKNLDDYSVIDDVAPAVVQTQKFVS